MRKLAARRRRDRRCGVLRRGRAEVACARARRREARVGRAGGRARSSRRWRAIVRRSGTFGAPRPAAVRGRSRCGGRREQTLREIESRAPGGAARRSTSARRRALAEELFTYSGSGTLFTRERYVDVRRLGIDDFGRRRPHRSAASPRDTWRRGRCASSIACFANGYGAFVEGRLPGRNRRLAAHCPSAKRPPRSRRSTR